jgi:hypothetical protein
MLPAPAPQEVGTEDHAIATAALKQPLAGQVALGVEVVDVLVERATCGSMPAHSLPTS